jgi:hypothetical protein
MTVKLQSGLDAQSLRMCSFTFIFSMLLTLSDNFGEHVNLINYSYECKSFVSVFQYS